MIRLLGVIANVEVVVERQVIVGALDKPSRWRVVVVGGEREAGVLGDLEHRLHQALAEGSLADDQRAIVILQRAGDDLGG